MELFSISYSIYSDVHIIYITYILCVVRFAYQDGEVKEVCPAPDEHPHALNFKRAAISLFQNTMNRLDLDHHALEVVYLVSKF